MIEYLIGDRVRILPHALTSGVGGEGIVEGYDEHDQEDFVIVRVLGEAGKKDFEQWLLPREIVPLQ